MEKERNIKDYNYKPLTRMTKNLVSRKYISDKSKQTSLQNLLPNCFNTGYCCPINYYSKNNI